MHGSVLIDDDAEYGLCLRGLRGKFAERSRNDQLLVGFSHHGSYFCIQLNDQT
jgi:hypothetical protein